MTTKLPRYTPVLVADPTPPLPHAAPAPAADAATVTEIPVAAAAAMRDRLGSQDARIAELESAMLDGAILSGLNYMRERDVALARAEAAEAERDRLALEVVALRGAMPDPALLDYAAGQLSVASRNVHIASQVADQYRDTEESLARAAARIRALATATPTPPAAEAVTGGEAK